MIWCGVITGGISPIDLNMQVFGGAVVGNWRTSRTYIHMLTPYRHPLKTLDLLAVNHQFKPPSTMGILL